MISWLHRCASVARRYLPAEVTDLVRAILTALISPFLWSWSTGHFRSSLRRASVSHTGQPLPWYTYPAIDFLSHKDFTERTVLEFGAGHSTIWWANRSKSVLALEDNRAWIERLRPIVPTNVELVLVNGTMPSFAGQFDIVVVDGLYRPTCAEMSTALTSPAGAIIFDNSDGEWAHPIMEMYRRLGFQRIDFYGWHAGVITSGCTSLLFKSECFLLDGTEFPS